LANIANASSGLRQCVVANGDQLPICRRVWQAVYGLNNARPSVALNPSRLWLISERLGLIAALAPNPAACPEIAYIA
jgi:hypothetical protein